MRNSKRRLALAAAFVFALACFPPVLGLAAGDAVIDSPGRDIQAIAGQSMALVPTATVSGLSSQPSASWRFGTGKPCGARLVQPLFDDAWVITGTDIASIDASYAGSGLTLEAQSGGDAATARSDISLTVWTFGAAPGAQLSVEQGKRSEPLRSEIGWWKGEPAGEPDWSRPNVTFPYRDCDGELLNSSSIQYEVRETDKDGAALPENARILGLPENAHDTWDLPNDLDWSVTGEKTGSTYLTVAIRNVNKTDGKETMELKLSTTIPVVVTKQGAPTQRPSQAPSSSDSPTSRPTQNPSPLSPDDLRIEETAEGLTLVGTPIGRTDDYVSVSELETLLKAKEGVDAAEVRDKDGEPCEPDEPAATGDVVSLRGGASTQTAVIVVLGDVTGTGIVNIAQLTRMAAAVSEARPLSGPYLEAALITGGSRLTIADLVALARILTGSQSGPSAPRPEASPSATPSSSVAPSPAPSRTPESSEISQEVLDEAGLRFMTLINRYREKNGVSWYGNYGWTTMGARTRAQEVAQAGRLLTSRPDGSSWKTATEWPENAVDGVEVLNRNNLGGAETAKEIAESLFAALISDDKAASTLLGSRFNHFGAGIAYAEGELYASTWLVNVVGAHAPWNDPFPEEVEQEPPGTQPPSGEPTPTSTPTVSAPEEPSQDILDAAAGETLDAINEARGENGLYRIMLSWYPRLGAEARATEMAEAWVLSHTRPDGSSFETAGNWDQSVSDKKELVCRFIPAAGSGADEIGRAAAEKLLASEDARMLLMHRNNAYFGAGMASGKDGMIYVAVWIAQVPPETGWRPLYPDEDESYRNQIEQETAAYVLDRVNSLRQSHGLPSLAQNEQLEAGARTRSAEMAASGVYSHTRPNGEKWTSAYAGPEYLYRDEIINLREHIGLTTPKELGDALFQSWYDSESHRSALLHPDYRLTGISITVGDDDGAYAVQWFVG